jgi:hypothetical protein
MSYEKLTDIMRKNYPPSDWVVDGLLRTGRRRPSLLLGKPEAGKSTLARQMAAAVTQGKPFLGRETKKSAVLYWQTEEEDGDIQSAFSGFGVTDADAPLYLFTGNAEESGPEDLAAELAKCLDVKLVIIETLDDLLRLNDIKENTGARHAFDNFNTVVMEPLAGRAAVIALWHLKKATTEFAGDALLGATVIRGRTDNKIFLQQYAEGDDRRVIFSSSRKGRSLPKTFLEFDAETGISTLGQTVAEQSTAVKMERTTDDTLTAIEYIKANPGCSMRDVVTALPGKSTTRLSLIHKLLLDGAIVNRGAAGRFELHIPVTIEAEKAGAPVPVCTDIDRLEPSAPCAPLRRRGPITVSSAPQVTQ